MRGLGGSTCEGGGSSEKKERLEAHFISRTVADDANDMVEFCGSMVPRMQLETGLW